MDDTWVRYPLARTSAGPVTGFLDSHRLSQRSMAKAEDVGDRPPIKKWLGIPYGQASRWERVQDLEPWEAPRECFEFGPAFPQDSGFFDKLYEGKKEWMTREFLGHSEDAFTVNVFAPAGPVVDLPVIVWIHGGNLTSGASNQPVYDPSEFVRQQWQNGKPCIVITGNYRLNVFGWLSTGDLTNTNGHHGNYGLHDCIKIFEWTRENIGAFGGASNNVTAMGESAGAVIIGVLFHTGRRLFQKAILESGNAVAHAFRTTPDFPFEGKLFELLGICRKDTANERITDLRNVSMQALMTANTRLLTIDPSMWTLTRDPAEPGWSSSIWQQIERGEYDPWIEAVILSYNTDEGTFLTSRGTWSDESKIFQMMKARGLYRESRYPRFKQLYPVKTLLEDKSNLRSLAATMLFHDTLFITPGVHFARSLAEQPNKVSGRLMKVFICQFDTIPRTLKEDFEFMGVLHTAEIPFVFNMAALWNYDEASDDAATAKVVGQLWSNFAYAANPGWPRYTSQNGSAISITQGGTITKAKFNEQREEHTQFWYPLIAEMANGR